MKKLFVLGLVAIGLVVLTQASMAQSNVNISPDKDNTLYENGTGSVSNGAGDHIIVGRTNQGSNNLRRGVIKFDIAGNIPPGQEITNVTLTVHVSQTAAGDEPICLYPLTADWGEGTSNSNANPGQGASSTTGDATWIHTFFSGSTWTTAGGDYALTGGLCPLVGGIGFYNFTTPEMITHVRNWYTNPAQNFGWLMIGNETASQTTKRVDSRENPTASFRPVLNVEYQPVVPTFSEWGLAGFVLLVGAGGAMLILRQRRLAKVE